jgi:sulfate adenylyltransferase subunit 1
VDLSRGDMLVKREDEPRSDKQLSAIICQVNNKALKVGNKYILQHGVNRVLAKVDQIESRIHTDFSGVEEVQQLKLNDIGKVHFRLSKAIHADSYQSNKSNGSFILIDEGSFDTVGVGFID